MDAAAVILTAIIMNAAAVITMIRTVTADTTMIRIVTAVTTMRMAMNAAAVITTIMTMVAPAGITMMRRIMDICIRIPTGMEKKMRRSSSCGAFGASSPHWYSSGWVCPVRLLPVFSLLMAFWGAK